MQCVARGCGRVRCAMATPAVWCCARAQLSTLSSSSLPSSASSDAEAQQEQHNTQTRTQMHDVGAEEEWRRAMATKYGASTHALCRAVYRDLCDEMRHEACTRPPPPLPPDVLPLISRCRSALLSSSSSSAATLPSAPHAKTTTDAGADAAGKDSCRTNKNSKDDSNGSSSNTATAAPPPPSSSSSPTAAPPSRPPSQPHMGDGSWSVRYRRENNVMVITRDAVAHTGQSRVVAYAPVVITDPPTMNVQLTHANYFTMEVMLERNDVVLHYSLVYVSSAMHILNVRVYDKAQLRDAARVDQDNTTTTRNAAGADTAAAAADVTGPLACTSDAAWVRNELLYDGPSVLHLEHDVFSELCDVLHDHGITTGWCAWVNAWVFYVEHVLQLRWSLDLLALVLPRAERGPEDDFLLPRERDELSKPVAMTMRSDASIVLAISVEDDAAARVLTRALADEQCELRYCNARGAFVEVHPTVVAADACAVTARRSSSSSSGNRVDANDDDTVEAAATAQTAARVYPVLYGWLEKCDASSCVQLLCSTDANSHYHHHHHNHTQASNSNSNSSNHGIASNAQVMTEHYRVCDEVGFVLHVWSRRDHQLALLSDDISLTPLPRAAARTRVQTTTAARYHDQHCLPPPPPSQQLQPLTACADNNNNSNSKYSAAMAAALRVTPAHMDELQRRNDAVVVGDAFDTLALYGRALHVSAGAREVVSASASGDTEYLEFVVHTA